MPRSQQATEDMEIPIMDIHQDEPPVGWKGERLLHGRKGDLLRFFIISFYGALIAGFIGWTFSGPPLSSSERVLQTGSILVDQFYSGLALSAIFTPLAMVIRNAGARLSKLHPFMVAKSKCIKIADLDKMSEGGILGAWSITQYSFEKGLTQMVILIAGTILVPFATLIITTATYVTESRSMAVIGLPVGSSDPGQVPLYRSMSGYNIDNPSFQQEVADLYRGQLLASAGMVPSFSTDILSSTPTANISFTNSTWYSGILTYQWDAGCEPAPEIAWNSTITETAWYINFWSPLNGTMSLEFDVFTPSYAIWMGDVAYPQYGYQPQNITSPGATAYYAIAGVTSQLVGNYQSSNGLVVGPDIWVSTVKCNARMNYEVSRCQWNGTDMVDCTAVPGGNTTELDTAGLLQLGDYLNSLPVAIAMQNEFLLWDDTMTVSLTYSFTPNRYRAPTVTDFTNMYGLVASSMVLDMTNGYYGTTTVPTVNESSKLVYAVRVPWLLGVSLAIFGCMILVFWDFVSSRVNQSPVREMSFITVAAATRGSWWDDQLDGLCAAPVREMRERATDKVTFGVEVDNHEHIGLALQTNPIVSQNRYRGLRNGMTGSGSVR